MTDPIADMLNRLKNAQSAKKEAVEVPYSRMKYALAKVLERKGFVKAVEIKGKKVRRVIDIALRYTEGMPRITGTKRISKPGQRVYAPCDAIRKTKGGRGISVLSTSKGLLSNAEAKKENMGGEIMCEVW